MEKHKTTIYIDKEIWKKFVKHVFRKYGKTHAGAISGEVENAIKKLLREE